MEVDHRASAHYINKANAVFAAYSMLVYIPDIYFCSTKNPAAACEEPVHIVPETKHYFLDYLPKTGIEYCKWPNGVEKIPG